MADARIRLAEAIAFLSELLDLSRAQVARSDLPTVIAPFVDKIEAIPDLLAHLGDLESLSEADVVERLSQVAGTKAANALLVQRVREARADRDAALVARDGATDRLDAIEALVTAVRPLDTLEEGIAALASAQREIERLRAIVRDGGTLWDVERALFPEVPRA